jgi:UDP-glucose 4-epimerase
LHEAGDDVTSIAWITGAQGFLGTNLAGHLASNGTRVAGIGHGHWASTDAAAAGVAHWVNADIHTASLDLLMADAGRPDVIYHLAGGSAVGPSFANPLEDFERTVHTTVRLLDWVRLNCPEVAIVAVSSAAVYGAGHEGAIAETASGRPYSPYGYHKSIMETLCRSYGQNFGLRAAIVRVFSAYGSGLRKQILWDLCTRLRGTQGELQLDGTGHERRDWIHASDVARLLQMVADRLPSTDVPVVNGATGEGHSVTEFVALVLDAWGGGRTVSFSGRSRPGDPVNLVADATRLHAVGFAPAIRLEQGIQAYVEWFRRATGQ